MNEWINRGRVAVYPRGEWSAALEYRRLDMVSAADRGKCYVAVQDVPAGTPLTDESCWRVSMDNSALQRQIDVERGRIDTFVTLPEGATTSDAEVADARVGWDGTVYPNAGTAVREQHGKLLGMLTDVRAYGVFPDAGDVSEPLRAALAASRRLYFPAGEYVFSDILITQDTALVLAPGAHFRAETTRMLTAYDCSLSIYGGTISCGEDFPDRPNTPYDDASRKMVYRSSSHNEGVIELYGCHDCVFEGIDIPWCSAPSAIMVYGDSRGKGGDRPVEINGANVVPGPCRNIRFNNCRFNNTLLSAIHVLYHCKNIVTDGCTFTNALRGTYKDGTLIPYAYTIYTGVKSIGVNGDIYLYYTPTDGYVFRNCYVENCEGTGVDTHAASNVLYENNTFIDCDSFITAYHDYRRVYTADGWVMENVIVRNNRCVNRKAFDYQGNEYPHNPFMLHNQGPEGTMRNVVVENNLIDTNWYRLSGSSPSEMVCLYSTDGVILRNNTIISRAETAIGYYISRCNGVVIENQTFEGAFNYGFHFVTSVIRMGAVFCTGATFNNAVMRINRVANDDGSISPYCCFVDTDNMAIDNLAVTEVSGWEYSLNRYGRPLQSVYSTLPLDGNVIADVKGYFGKNSNKWLQTIAAIDGNRVTVSNACRAIPGLRIVIGTATYYVMSVESYWASPDAESKTYVYVLDNEVTETSEKYIYLSAPMSSKYSYPNSDEFSQSPGKRVASTDFNDYTTPGVYVTDGRAFVNGPFVASSYSRLEVSYSVTYSTYIQKLYAPTEAYRGLYIRYRMSSGSWTPWRKVDSDGTGGITNELDPTVPDWAKRPNPPTAEELGAASIGEITTGTDMHIYPTEYSKTIPLPENHTMQSMCIVNGYLYVCHLLNNTGNTFVSKYNFATMDLLATVETEIDNHSNSCDYLSEINALVICGANGPVAFGYLSDAEDAVFGDIVLGTSLTKRSCACTSENDALFFLDACSHIEIAHKMDNYLSVYARAKHLEKIGVMPSGDATHSTSFVFLSYSLDSLETNLHKPYIAVFNNNGKAITNLVLPYLFPETQGLCYYNNTFYFSDPYGKLYCWERNSLPVDWAKKRKDDVNKQPYFHFQTSLYEETAIGSYRYVSKFRLYRAANPTEYILPAMFVYGSGRYGGGSAKLSGSSYSAVCSAPLITDSFNGTIAMKYTANNTDLTTFRLSELSLFGADAAGAIVSIRETAIDQFHEKASAYLGSTGVYGIFSIGSDLEAISAKTYTAVK